MSQGTLGTLAVGPSQPVFVIAEVAQAHDGSLGAAHAYIDAAAAVGASAIKFQTHIAAAESTIHEPWRVRFSLQDDSRLDYWRRMEFTEPQWVGLKQHADDKGLVFLSSPFSMAAVDLLERIGMPAWKVGSGEVTNLPFLKRIAATQQPVLLSSGMSTWAELDAAMTVIRDGGAATALFQCSTAYPCPADQLGLNVIAELKQRYPQVPIGLSDHSANVAAGLGAVALGVDLLEVHMCFSHHQFGPDTRSSLTIEQLKSLIDGAAFLRTALQHPIDKDAYAATKSELKRTFGKSIVLTTDLRAGTVLTSDMLALKKPGTGIPAAQLDVIVGRTLRVDVPADRPLSFEELLP
jgi:N,N'-diacetyllegionaminate synthase